MNSTVKGWFALPPTQLEIRSFRGASDHGFSSCAAPTYYSVSKYFVQESGSAEFYFQGLEIQKLSVALISKEHRVWIKARVFLEVLRPCPTGTKGCPQTPSDTSCKSDEPPTS